MEFRILDKDFRDQIILSRYESMLWVDRYNECGDFEIYTPPTDELLEYAVCGNYIYSKDSEHMMVIEHVELNTSYEEGPRLIVKGRSLECILARRILWYKTQFRSNLEDGIRQILDYSIINPTDEDRKIDNFVFEYSEDPRITAIFVNSEFNIGTDLLTVISELCQAANVGFMISLNDQDQFVFKLYYGANRSYSQDSNPWVVFSNRFHNIKTTQFSNDITDFKNAIRTVGRDDGENPPIDFIKYGGISANILDVQGGGTEEPEVQIEDGSHQFSFLTGKLKIGTTYSFTSKIEIEVGEPTSIHCELVGQVTSRVYAQATPEIQNGRIITTFTVNPPSVGNDDCYYLVVYSGSGNTITLVNPIFSIGEYEFQSSGLDRREYYNDASGVEYTEEMTDAEYEAQLVQSAYDTIDKKIAKTEINGEVEVNATFQYKKDYFMGDIVQVENEFGVLGTMRVTEFITSHSSSGIEMYPTFKSTSVTGGV